MKPCHCLYAETCRNPTVCAKHEEGIVTMAAVAVPAPLWELSVEKPSSTAMTTILIPHVIIESDASRFYLDRTCAFTEPCMQQYNDRRLPNSRGPIFVYKGSRRQERGTK